MWQVSKMDTADWRCTQCLFRRSPAIVRADTWPSPCSDLHVDEDLLRTLRLLRISGILGAAVRQADGGYRVWIGDVIDGVRQSATVPAGAAASWFVSQALRNYPSSPFARAHAFIGRVTAESRAILARGKH